MKAAQCVVGFGKGSQAGTLLMLEGQLKATLKA
jgi:hypothetical protein